MIHSKMLLMLTLTLTLTLTANAQEYVLTWAEEFDGEGFPDEEIWDCEHGYVRNHEAQWYQRENAFQENGMLVIEARLDSSATHRYTSASITSRRGFQFKYGRLEVRAKIPTAGGAWPAIWMLGQHAPWPSCGEVDIMEYYRIKGRPHILANVAWGDDTPWHAVWNSKRIPFRHFLKKDQDWAEKFHAWRLDWDSTEMAIYLDDELLNRIPLKETVNGSIGHYKNPFHCEQYVLLNLALGGDNGGKIDDKAFPMRYEVDYVRWYKRK